MSNINKVGYQYIGLLNNIPSNLKNSRESGITFRGYSENEEKSLTQCKIISTKNTEGESVASNLAFYLAGNEPLSNKYDPNEYPALFMENDGMMQKIVVPNGTDFKVDGNMVVEGDIRCMHIIKPTYLLAVDPLMQIGINPKKIISISFPDDDHIELKIERGDNESNDFDPEDYDMNPLTHKPIFIYGFAGLNSDLLNIKTFSTEDYQIHRSEIQEEGKMYKVYSVIIDVGKISNNTSNDFSSLNIYNAFISNVGEKNEKAGLELITHTDIPIKSILFDHDKDSWSFSHNINIPETASLKINNETVLSNTDYIDENNVVTELNKINIDYIVSNNGLDICSNSVKPNVDNNLNILSSQNININLESDETSSKKIEIKSVNNGIGEANIELISDNYLKFNTNNGDVLINNGNNNNIGVGLPDDDLNGIPSARLHVNGAILANNIAGISDKKFKINVKTIENALPKILNLRGVYYEWDVENFPQYSFPLGEKQIGFIAQEMEKEFPEIVNIDRNNTRSLSYDKFCAVLLESIKELNTKFENYVKNSKAEQNSLMNSNFKQHKILNSQKDDIVRQNDMLIKYNENMEEIKKIIESQNIKLNEQQKIIETQKTVLLQQQSLINKNNIQITKLKANVIKLKNKSKESDLESIDSKN